MRQDENDENGKKLAIFNKDGEPIEDESLCNQVVNALARYPILDDMDDA